MSDNIATMNDKQLRNEVQLLRDELAIMKRKYEDILYNLDTDNFSQRIVKQGKDMYTKIEQTADEISLQAEKIEDNETKVAELSVTAGQISSEVSDVKKDVSANKSLIEQTANSIESTVESVVNDTYIKDKLGDEYLTDATFRTNLRQDAYGIYATVEETYETKSDANEAYSDLNSYISNVSIETDNISTKVGKLENGKYGSYTLFTQSDDTFLFDGDKTVFTGCVYLTDNNDKKAFSIFLNQGDYDAFYMWGYGDYDTAPIILGNTYGNGVYIGSYTDNNRVATRQWVRENAGGGSSVAVFA